MRADDPPTIMNDVAPEGYQVFHRHTISKGKSKSRGGGIVMVLRKEISAKDFKLKFNATTFEHLSVKLTSGYHRLSVTTIYRPPPTPSNLFLMNSTHFVTYSKLLQVSTWLLVTLTTPV